MVRMGKGRNTSQRRESCDSCKKQGIAREHRRHVQRTNKNTSRRQQLWRQVPTAYAASNMRAVPNDGNYLHPNLNNEFNASSHTEPGHQANAHRNEPSPKAFQRNPSTGHNARGSRRSSSLGDANVSQSTFQHYPHVVERSRRGHGNTCTRPQSPYNDPGEEHGNT